MTSSIPTLPLESPRRLLVLCFALTGVAVLAWLGRSLNPAAPVLSFTLWALAALAIADLLVQAVVSWRVSQRPVPALQGPQPATDVMLWAGEHETGVLRQALRSAQALSGPHALYLLSLRPAGAQRLAALQALATEVGCTLVFSEDGADDAASLANQALALGDAPFVAWLDGSHACRRDFLQNTLGHFADPQRAFVQTAPGMPGESAPGSRSGGSDLSRLWRRWMSVFTPGLARRQWHLGWDRWNATLWSGSGAVIRRSALRAAGGFAGAGSDLFIRTTARLQALGHHGVWHAERMAFSVAPEPESVSVERPSAVAAWAALLGSGALGAPGLTPAQRLRHLAEALGATLPLLTALGLAVPVLSILADALPLDAASPQFVQGPFWLLPLVLLGALVHTELSAGAHGTVQRLGHRLARLGHGTQLTLLALNAMAAVAAVLRAQGGSGDGGTAAAGWLGVAAWSTLNAFVLGSAMAAARHAAGRVRRSQRFAVTLAAELIDADGTRVHGTVDDLSRSGLRFYGSLLPSIALHQHLRCTLHLPDGPLAVTGEVRHLGTRDNDSMHQPRSVGLKMHLSASRRKRIETFLFSSDLQWRLQGHVELPVTPLARLFPLSFGAPQSTLARRHWNGAQLRPHVRADATPVLCAAPIHGQPDEGELLVSHVRLPEQVPLILDVFRRRAVPSRGVMLHRLEDPATVGAQTTALFAYRALPAEMPGVPVEYLVAASPFVLVEDEPLVLTPTAVGHPGTGAVHAAMPVGA